ncbi:MAG: acetylornithine/succinylornithine family transaminase [Oscillospiraceae bacterium]|nr:acetylornithine/succinylornithine family transaminase [Oscillospiraceae bacterium]
MNQQHLMPTYARFPVALVSGAGATAVGDDGKTYIDFGAGIGVNALGYCPDGWVEAVSLQAAALQHVSNLYHQPVSSALAAELCAAAGMAAGAAFLCNSGAEANECAVKLARKYSFDKYGEGRHTILTLENSFHGRTVTTLAATGQDGMHTYFHPFTEGFRYLPAGDLAAAEAAMERYPTDDGSVCAVLIECVQGEGGVVPLDNAYLQGVRALCAEKDILFMVDEVQTGAGRTGKFLACEHSGVAPDVVTMAKGLGGGLPIGACLCAEPLKGVLSAGTHGSTYGGNPIAAAGARYMLSVLKQPEFLAEVTRKGDYIRQRLAAVPQIERVQGLGMMLGLVLADGIDAKAVANKCAEAGLLVLTAKTLLRLLPPLNISDPELDAGLGILEQVLAGSNN